MLELATEFQQLSILEWGLAFAGALVVGFSKSGIKGLGVLFVTFLALAFGGKASTGILLPMLITGDILAVWYYNRHVELKYLWQLLPWMVIGVLIGVWVGMDLPEVLFKRGMAIIILLTVFLMFFWEYRKTTYVPNHWTFGGIMGLAAGFTTMVGNLAGAFSNIFFLAMRVPKNNFIGTSAWLFFLINIFKVPFHIFAWETMSVDTIAVNLRLIPAVFIGFFLGIMLVKKISETGFRKMILFLTALGAILIFFR